MAFVRIFEHVDVDAARQAAVMEDSPAGDRAALDFGLDWMELVIFGKSQGLTRK